MQLLPIKKTLDENPEFRDHSDCQPNLQISIDYFERVGYDPPWIGYYAQVEDKLVGAGGFKGRPIGGIVEIDYGTFPAYQGQGFGTEICRQLVQLALQANSSVRITARTLPENYASAGILKRNGFSLRGTVHDEEDGEVLLWEYAATPISD
ncbi:GNAT family N-acetyltransferase [Telluribacter sp.]|jgi:RimJ/RimL family protein N-acetyltransferase|uniref:GNAT family N-acetyltransferase n=1 Tax=Telluribacter sp. TaxID=1978767 RepID=UPI002E122D06|nr:GNAT family N-acetyltransferase [Telluribacter sp.]